MTTTDKLSSRNRLVLAAADTQALAEAFCTWPLPASVCSDSCATMPGYPNRSGTNLITVAEAKAMFDHLAEAGLIQVMPAALRDVVAERRRQVEIEGWTPEHDDQHDDGQLALAAVCYALPEYQQGLRTAAHPGFPQPTILKRLWPWAAVWWKPGSVRSMLVKAGALILAEIERLDRATLAQASKPEAL